MPKIWEKSYQLDKEVEAFTVGDDCLADQKLAKYDAIASAAHAKTLRKAGILNSSELASLLKGLSKIYALARQGKFSILPEEEDMHAAIESWLTKNIGKAGAKIHTARSRNDQVLAAVRLYSSDKIIETGQALVELCEVLLKFSQKNHKTEMPGYTHLQRAMPSTVGLWSSALLEALLDDAKLLAAAHDLNSQSPLGSGSGYGTPLKTDREYTAKLLGFRKVQNNFLYVQNSRGKIEAAIVAALSQIMLDLSRHASDILLFTTSEFGFFSLPDELLTGSSMMPQKKNYDLLELTRAKSSVVLANEFALKSLIEKLPSGYNRDFQLTKKPLIDSFETTIASLGIVKLVFSKLQPNKEKLKAALTSEIYSTHRAYSMLGKKSFREAYKEAAGSGSSIAFKPESANLRPSIAGIISLKAGLKPLKTAASLSKTLFRM